MNQMVLNPMKGCVQVVYGGHILGVIRKAKNKYQQGYKGTGPKYGINLSGSSIQEVANKMVESYLNKEEK